MKEKCKKQQMKNKQRFKMMKSFANVARTIASTSKFIY